MKKELLALLKERMTADIATTEGNQPRVRPMTLMFFHERFWMATGASDAKTEQLKHNPLVEVLVNLEGEGYRGYLRISGKAIPINDFETKKDIADLSGFVYHYFESAESLEYALFEIVPTSIRYMRPGDMLETKML